MKSSRRYLAKKIAVQAGPLIFTVLLMASLAEAREASRRIEDEKRESLAATEYSGRPASDRRAFDYGGWVNFRYIDYNEDDKNSALPDDVDYTTWQDYRLWWKAVFRPLDPQDNNELLLYLRLKDLYSDSRPKETAGGSDNDGPHIDYAYAMLEVAPVQLKAGRSYFSVGQGIAYSDVHDGIEMAWLSGKLNARAFFSHTLPHQDNIDTSVPGYDKDSDRFFYGLQCDYLGIAGQSLYGYALIQRDYSDEQPQDPLHDYAYNSEYFGLGARGKLKSVFSYWWEIIGETGKSFIYDTDEKEDIRAWAQVFALAYDPAVYSHPSLYFKYAFGSGDKDRMSVTDTLNGNSAGRDTNFLYFGYLPAGYALAPQLSNMYFFKTGFTCKPLEQSNFFKSLVLGIDYYKYYKDKKTAGIYDTQATEPERDIGQEVDINLSWQILSDLNCSLQYGHFMPADAYADTANDSEDYFSVSTTIAF